MWCFSVALISIGFGGRFFLRCLCAFIFIRFFFFSAGERVGQVGVIELAIFMGPHGCGVCVGELGLDGMGEMGADDSGDEPNASLSDSSLSDSSLSELCSSESRIPSCTFLVKLNPGLHDEYTTGRSKH